MKIATRPTRLRTLKQAGFVLLPMMFIGLHLLVSGRLSEFVNSLSFAAFELVGVALFVYSIDSTLGIYHRGSMITAAKEWFRELFTFRKKSAAVELKGQAVTASLGKIEGHAFVEPKSLEQRLAHLERELAEHKTQTIRSIAEIRKEITGLAQETHELIASVESRLRIFSDQVEASDIQGLKVQIAGGLCLVYGILAPIFLGGLE
ncbi:MAG: hypothetical protein AAGI44_07180 [Pseudomonadota bacterium]